jgi:lipase ATG15
MRFRQSEILDWIEDQTVAPDVENRETLLELAKMTNNAYVERDDPAWYDIGPWNIVRSPSLCVFNFIPGF